MTTKIKQSTEQKKEKSHDSEIASSKSNIMYNIHKAVVHQLHKKRQGNANCKTRSEVRGGGKKPWKQKGTGKARAGSTRSPLWRGGGVIFGPKSKEYNQKINKKEKRLAIKNILQNKQDTITTIDQSFLQFDKPKTRILLEKIKKLDIRIEEKILVIMVKKHWNTYLSARNLKNIEIIAANQINLLSIIEAKHILIEQEAIKTVDKIYHG